MLLKLAATRYVTNVQILASWDGLALKEHLSRKPIFELSQVMGAPQFFKSSESLDSNYMDILHYIRFRLSIETY